MAVPIWKSYAIRPLGFPGVAKAISWVERGSDAADDAILEARAYYSSGVVSDPLVSTEPYLDLPLEANGQVYSDELPQEPVVFSWWARTALGWSAGPTTSADLSSDWDSNFPTLKLWAVAKLQSLAKEAPSLPLDRVVAVRGAFPRDNFPLPCVSVQFKASPQGSRVIGDVSGVVGGRLEEAVSWTMSLDLMLWTDTPEERDTLHPWFLRALQALAAMASYKGLVEPNYSVTEAEDFSAAFMERPIFLLQASFSGTVWSKLALPQHNYIGHLTV